MERPRPWQRFHAVDSLLVSLVLAMFFHRGPIVVMTAGEYWLVVGLCGSVLVVVCAVTDRVVEHPFMKLPIPV